MDETFGDVIDLDEVLLGKEVRDLLLPGSKAGPWRIEGELGKGGMGTVYAVVHEEIGKRAALKVMHRTMLGSGVNVRDEGRLANQVAHPGVVDIFETGTLPDGRPYIVMEQLSGITLGQRAREDKILPDEVIAILLELCDALLATHAAGIIHRDLKLDNVFLVAGATQRIKLLDWSVAKLIKSELWQTIEGIAGTPYYIAPEQAAGRPISPKTDVYSLGVMAYELFLEQLPFDAETVAEVLVMHLRTPPPVPSELWPAIPARLEALLLAMLAKDPNDRPKLVEVIQVLAATSADIAERRTTGHTPPVAAIEEPPVAARPRSRVASALLTLALGATTMTTVHTAAPPLEAATLSVPVEVTSTPVVASAVPPLVREPEPSPEPAALHAITPDEPPVANSEPPVAIIPDEPPVANPAIDPPSPRTVTRTRVALSREPPPRRPMQASRGTYDATPIHSARDQPSKQSRSIVMAPVTAESLVAQYKAVGRQLKALQDERGSDATVDLWPRYRMIQLHVALASAELRTMTATTLERLMDAAMAR